MERHRVTLDKMTQHYKDVSFSKLIYKFNSSLVKSPTSFFMELVDTRVQVEKQTCNNTQQNTEKQQMLRGK